MKLSKIVSLMMAIVLLVSLFSCDGIHVHNGGQTNQSNNTTNNANDSEADQEDKTPPKYVYSVTAKVMHLPDCYHINRINEEYLFEYNGDLADMIEKGYTVCKTCLVPKEEKPKEEEKEPEEEEIKIPPEDVTFVINKNSGKVHELDCRYAIEMKEANKEYTNLTLEELLAIEDAEYSPCATCMPAEAEKHKEEHPEKYEK